MIWFSEHVYYSVATFPIGGEKFYLKNGKSFTVYPGCCPKVEDDQGVFWEYRGLSAYKVDNDCRVRGWQKVYCS